jgi:hypothetical protein
MRVVMVEYPKECLSRYPSKAEIARAWNAKYSESDRITARVVERAADAVCGKVETALRRRGLLKARVERSEMVQEDMSVEG